MKLKNVSSPSKQIPNEEPSVIVQQLNALDFDKEYRYLTRLLRKRNLKPLIDLSGAAFRSWRLYTRAKRDVKELKSKLDDIYAQKRVAILQSARGKYRVTEKQIESIMREEPKAKSINKELEKAEEILEVCYGMAIAFGIKQEYYRGRR